MKYLHEKQFNCLSPYKYDKERKPELVQQRAEMINACHTIKKGLPTRMHRYENIAFHTCVCNFYDPQISTLIEIAKQYKEIGPNPNVYMYYSTQISAKLMNFIRFINNFISQKEIEETQRQNAKLKKG